MFNNIKSIKSINNFENGIPIKEINIENNYFNNNNFDDSLLNIIKPLNKNNTNKKVLSINDYLKENKLKEKYRYPKIIKLNKITNNDSFENMKIIDMNNSAINSKGVQANMISSNNNIYVENYIKPKINKPIKVINNTENNPNNHNKIIYDLYNNIIKNKNKNN